jgi:hypothetical protein
MSKKLLAIIWLLPLVVRGQEMPPRPVSIVSSVIHYLNFGDFTTYGSGGTVTISATGSRTAIGDIILMNSTWSPAIFYVTANPGTLVSIYSGTEAILNGSNGGTLRMTVGETWPVSPLVIPLSPPVINLQVGATLEVGPTGSNPPGIYTGTFHLIFIQE